MRGKRVVNSINVLVTGVNDVNHLENLKEMFGRFRDTYFKGGFLTSIIQSKKQLLFYPNLSLISPPLYKLLQKNINMIGYYNVKTVLNQLKKITQCIGIFYRSLLIRLACDASQIGSGAVLSHVMPDGTDRPISFILKVITINNKGCNNNQAACMSRIPLNNKVQFVLTGQPEYDYVHFVEEQNVIDLKIVRSETKKNQILSSVHNMIRYGFRKEVNEECLKKNLKRKDELYILIKVLLSGDIERLFQVSYNKIYEFN